MRNRALILGFFLTVSPAAVAAQSASGTGSAAASAQSSADAQARINAALEQAVSVGIPTALLESKIAEGRAKGVAMARLATAVEHRLDVLTQVQGAIAARGAAATQAELAAAATAMEAGARKEDVQKVHESAQPEQRPAALTLLAELIAEGRVPEQAVKGVQVAIAAQSQALLRLQGVTAGSASANGAAQGSAAASGAKTVVDVTGVAGVKVGRGN